MSNSKKQTLEQWAGYKRLNLALLFTDIVSSTAIGQKLGDNVWMEELAKHFERGRDLVKEFDCYVVKVIGDAFMVAFRNSTDALDFAVKFSLNTGVEFIGIRVGIHSGQVQIMDNDIYGLNVNKAARIQSSLDKEGICVSSSIKEDHVKAYGSSSTLKFTKLEKEIKNFPTTKPWKVLSKELISVYGATALKRQRILGIPPQQPTVQASNSSKSETKPSPYGRLFNLSEPKKIEEEKKESPFSKILSELKFDPPKK